MDLITETETDLSCSKGHATVVEIEQSAEVDEDTLCSFRSEETTLSTGGPNRGLKHKVKGKGFREVVVGLWGLNAEFLNGGI
jgi:hypothetical protein